MGGNTGRRIGRKEEGDQRGRAKPVSLAPLTPDEALAAALRVKKSDVDEAEKDQKGDKERSGDEK